MTKYFFDFESTDKGSYAEADGLGGAVKIHLQEFMDPLPHVYPYNVEELRIAVLKAVLVHEDLHVAIDEVLDTTGDQQHETVYSWVYRWLNDDK